VSTVKLNYKVLGEDQKDIPKVILHGLFGMLDNWQSIGKQLAESGYKVYLVDQRDHGRSPFTDEFSYPILANDLLAFLDEHDLFKIHLIGHSMGGKTAMQFALDHPFYLEKLIVIDIWNKTYKGGHEAVFNAIETLDINKVDNRNDIYLHLISHQLDEGTAQFLLKNLQRKSEGGYEWKMNYKLLAECYQAILGSVGDPSSTSETDALFVRGGESNYIKVTEYDDILKQFHNASFAEIAGAGHWVHADKPAELLKTMISFF
jgi:esterase